MKKTLFIIILCALSSLIWAQDIIVTRDAKRIEAKILEVSKSEVKYKDWSNTEGPTFVLDTREITSVVYSNGSVQLFNEQPVTQQEATSQSVSNQPNVDWANFHGLLIAEGNCVYVPTDGPTNYERAGQLSLKRALRSADFWKVVDDINQAHFVMQYGVCLKGMDEAYIYMRSVSSYHNTPELSYKYNGWNGNKVKEPQSVIFAMMPASEKAEENAFNAEVMVSVYLPKLRAKLWTPGWIDKKEAKNIKENLWIP